jgi:hypothetical protein
MNFQRSLLVIIFAAQLGGGVASAAVHPDRVVLGHDLIVTAQFLSSIGHLSEEGNLLRKIPHKHRDLLDQYEGDSSQSNSGNRINHPLPEGGAGPDIIKHSENAVDPVDKNRCPKCCLHRNEDTNECDDQ